MRGKSIVLPLLTGLAAARKKKRRPAKRTGEISEAAFVWKAESLGFHVAKPWGDSNRYDFIVDSGARLWRVQLKCTEVLNHGAYEVNATYCDYTNGKSSYGADEIDVLVAHIPPIDLWYVLPLEAFTPRTNLRFYPGRSGKVAYWEQYREAWHLLRAQPVV